MSTSRWTRVITAVAVALAGAGTTLHAQGVTTASVSGTVTDQAGKGIESAQVEVVNQSTGVRTGAMSRAGGVFYVQGLQVGGPYTVTVRRIGFQPDEAKGIRLSLGQDFKLAFRLQEQAAQLGPVTVVATNAASVFSPSNEGVETLVSDSAMRRLPSLNRNFTDLMNLSPMVSQSGPGNSAGGVNNRFNNIQIDGVGENDLFGLGSTGQPGGQAAAKSIPFDAVREYQVILSPYDVRQGDFAGALINAVTKSGTNEFHGSAYEYFYNQNLAQNIPFIRQSQLKVQQFGVSVGGPIVKDKIHFFINPEWQTRSQPAFGPYVGQGPTATVPLGASEADIQRFITDLKNYGITPGSAGAINDGNPLTNLFARFDVALPSIESRLVFHYNYDKAYDDIFSRSTSTFNLSSNGYTFNHTKNAPALQLFTNFANGNANELTIGYNSIRDRRSPNVYAPQISVSVPGTQTATATLVAGSERYSQGNALDQDLFELTDNFTIPVGTQHRITIGTHDEHYRFRNVFTQASYGVWSFDSLGAFESGTPTYYTVSGSLGGPLIARFSGWMLGAYAEDNWHLNDRFNVTYGLRLDMPVLSTKPAYTQVVYNDFNRSTSDVPSGNVQWSPRVGFNWDVTGDSRNQIRGGLGVFTGRPAYVWLGDVYSNTGSGIGFVNCGPTSAYPGTAPAFNPDPASQPMSCAGGTGALGTSGSIGEVDFMNKNLKYPQVLRASLSYDRQLGGGFVGTLEGLYTRGLNNIMYVNLNLVGPQGTDAHGRVMYGTIDSNGRSHPAIVSSKYSFVTEALNQSSDYSYDLTAQLSKRFSHNLEAVGSYTFSHSYDVMSLTSSIASSNWKYSRDVSGNQYDKTATPSAFDQPNKVLLSVIYTAPWKKWRTDFTAGYQGMSGGTYDYVYTGFSGRGDLNADGIVGNDLIYVPKSTTDPNEIEFQDIVSGTSTITAAQQASAFETFIKSTPCLADHRGQLLGRNACRNPWQSYTTFSVNQFLPAYDGRTLSVRLDIFNFLNLLNSTWGRNSSAGPFEDVSLLTQSGVDPITGNPVFQFRPNYEKFVVANSPSNYYQMELSVRLAF